MKHQIAGRKLNISAPHRRAMLRNQAIHFILYGKLVTTPARIKEVKRIIEKLVTLARKGNTFANRRMALSELPYSKPALNKLFVEIAPKYVSRPGGYTRMLRLGRRASDTAEIAQLTWVESEVSQ